MSPHGSGYTTPNTRQNCGNNSPGNNNPGEPCVDAAVEDCGDTLPRIPADDCGDCFLILCGLGIACVVEGLAETPGDAPPEQRVENSVHTCGDAPAEAAEGLVADKRTDDCNE